MRRRELITLLGGAAVAWPLAARAQQPANLKQATSVIPIVLAFSGDLSTPSLGRPGGNVTSLSLQATDLTGKRLSNTSTLQAAEGR